MVRLFGWRSNQMQWLVFVVVEERLFWFRWSPTFQFFHAAPDGLIISGNRRLRHARDSRCGWQLDPKTMMSPSAHANKRVNGAWRNLKVQLFGKKLGDLFVCPPFPPKLTDKVFVRLQF
ncbi:MAG: hypothetical protein DMG11_03335 [Acidobacteria bacterium]|nr:MAG: hypothetical protein DMG11_03335 [Acidobacteriota bacterium]